MHFVANIGTHTVYYQNISFAADELIGSCLCLLQCVCSAQAMMMMQLSHEHYCAEGMDLRK